MHRSPAIRRYNRRVLILSALYAVLLLGVSWLFAHHLLGGPVSWIAAMLPALPILGVFAAIGRYLVEEQDEYVRMMMVRQSLIASGFALGIATVWGFLESFEMVGHVEAFYVAVLWFAGLGVGACVNKLWAGRA